MSAPDRRSARPPLAVMVGAGLAGLVAIVQLYAPALMSAVAP